MSSATPSEPDPETTPKSKPGLDHKEMQAVSNQIYSTLINYNFGLSENPNYPGLTHEEINELVHKLIDSHQLQELVNQFIGESWIKGQTQLTEWNADLNQRRFELIDKEIQETISTEESIELAGLTKLMRDQLDNEQNLPLKGAKELHRKLLEIDQKDESQ